jgi:signal transduction histidine kinase
MADAQPAMVIGPDAVIDACGVPMWIAHDPQGRQVSPNRAALALRAAIADEPGAEATVVPVFLREGSPLAAEEQPLARCLREGVALEMPELSLRRPGGELLYVAARATPLRDATGAVTGAVLACTDVTAWRSELESRRVADRRKDEFLAHLGHDLRNPLAPIRTAIQILRMPGLEPERVDDLMKVTERQVMDMARLIDQLMDIGHLGLGKLKLHRERAELSTIVDDAVGASSKLIGSAGHSLELHLPDVPMPVEADSQRLSQALSNVIDNAAKFTDPGGRIEVSAESAGGYGIIRVRDNGYGLAPETLAQLFTPFMRGPQQSRHAGNGLGIGLALARSLVELHEGSIQAHSDGVGRGCEFVVRIPLAA